MTRAEPAHQEEMAVTRPGRGNSIRQSARIADARLRCHSFPARTNRCIAGIAFRPCEDSNSLATLTINLRASAIAPQRGRFEPAAFHRSASSCSFAAACSSRR